MAPLYCWVVFCSSNEIPAKVALNGRWLCDGETTQITSVTFINDRHDRSLHEGQATKRLPFEFCRPARLTVCTRLGRHPDTAVYLLSANSVTCNVTHHTACRCDVMWCFAIQSDV
eukprot:scpid78797/ scgid20983/ 